MIYKRKYTGEIIKLTGYFPVVGIIGARQVGKTTITHLLRNELSKDFYYIDLELPSDLNKMQNPELFLSGFVDQCVIIDEIQLLPELFASLRSITDRRGGKGCQFLITGSASPRLLRQSTESLAGRIAYVEISPFSIDELPGFIDLQHHWFWGGFPKVLFAPDNTLASKWLQNFIKTYIERDLSLFGLPPNPVLLRRLWTMLAHFNGNVINYSTLSSSLGISVVTVKKYIDFFEQAFLIKRLQPYYVNIKKRLVKSPKIYMADTGILHALLNIGSITELFGHPAVGSSWEAYCINQILNVAGGNFDAGFFRTHDGSECDLVLTKGGRPVYAVEIKFSETPKLTRGNTLAFAEIKATKNYIVVPQSGRYPLNHTVEVVGIKDLITELIQPGIAGSGIPEG